MVGYGNVELVSEWVALMVCLSNISFQLPTIVKLYI